MRYYFCRFKTYLLVVFTSSHDKALRRLVEYVRVSKGNLGYSEEDIRNEGKVDVADFVDDTGHITALLNISKRLDDMNGRFARDIAAARGELAEVQAAMRRALQAFDDEGWMNE